MEGPSLGPGGEDITWPDQVAPRGRKASSTRKIKIQTSNLLYSPLQPHKTCWLKEEFRKRAVLHVAGALAFTTRRRGVAAREHWQATSEASPGLHLCQMPKPVWRRQ